MPFFFISHENLHAFPEFDRFLLVKMFYFLLMDTMKYQYRTLVEYIIHASYHAGCPRRSSSNCSSDRFL